MAVDGHPSNLDPGSTYSMVITVTLPGAASYPEAVEGISILSMGAGIDSIAVPDLSGNPMLLTPGASNATSLLFTIESDFSYSNYPDEDPISFIFKLLTNATDSLISATVVGFATWPVPDGISITTQPSAVSFSAGGPTINGQLQLGGSNISTNEGTAMLLAYLRDDSDSVLASVAMSTDSGVFSLASSDFSVSLGSAVNAGDILVRYSPTNASEVSTLVGSLPSVVTSTFSMTNS